MCLLHRWQVQVVVGSNAVGLVSLGGQGLDSMSPARIRRAARNFGVPMAG